MIVTEGSSVLVVVPARGGSKGVPRKNLLPVAGKPLLAWTVEHVAAAETAVRCVVSTDDDEIAALAAKLGAEVVRRPAELAADESPTEPALLHALDVVDDADQIERVVLLQATSPVRRPGGLDRALHLHAGAGATSVVGVVEASPFLWQGPVDAPAPRYDVDHRPRRQDLGSGDLVYRETGSLYVTTAAALRASGNRISGTTMLFVMSPEEGLDIDTRADVDEAERLLGGGAHAAGP